jgi:polysaccharide export outer membrane protein
VSFSDLRILRLADQRRSSVHFRPGFTQELVSVMLHPSALPARLRVAAFATVLLLAAQSRLEAQQLPTTDQARRLLEARPDLVAQLRRELMSSGMTADQVRARLRASGYPENLLDAYLVRRPGADSLSLPVPSDDVLDAIASLGISDSSDVMTLRQQLKQRRARLAGRDTLPIRRNGRLADSLDLTDTLPVTPRRQRDTLDLDAERPLRVGDRLATVDSGMTLFGLSVFESATTQFDANLSGPVDANYRLGPGDRLVLIITGDAERSYNLDVTREGFVLVPGIGELGVNNLTLAQLEDLLYPRLARVYSGIRRSSDATTHFSINLARLRTNQVFVLGDVYQPGSYRVSSAGTALSALYAAGGPTRNGGMRRVEIRRGGRIVDTLDVYDYLLRADATHDPRLQSGDVVFVPVHGARVRVYGEVIRPSTYELKKGETLADAIRAAGGFTAEASRRRVQISRVLPPSQRDTTDRARVVIDVASEQFVSGTGPAYPIEPGDVIQVFPVSERVSRRVSVRGDVWTPGAIGYTTGMKLSDAIRVAGGIKPDAFLEQVLVSRLRPSDSTRVQLRTSFADSSGRPVEDIPLREDDEIRIFSNTELRATQYVAITGAVRTPGRIAYRDGMTMRDLILLAGGLDEHAFIGEAEIARLPLSRDGGKLAETIRVPLDSSYLVARQSRNAPGVAQAGRVRGAAVELQPFDNVLILAQPNWERPRRVVLTGEVRYPGTYTLTTKQERLSDLLKRAGGLTATAYTEGIVFYRNDGHVGRVGVDLARALRDPGFRDNLLLQDGDSIHLPVYSGIVEVQGAVNSPRGVAWVPGADLNYYVRAAGGGSKLAEPSHSYVTQPDGNVESIHERTLWPDAIPVPRAGATVTVVEKDASDKTDPIARLSVLAQVIGGIVTLVAVIRR